MWAEICGEFRARAFASLDEISTSLWAVRLGDEGRERDRSRREGEQGPMGPVWAAVDASRTRRAEWSEGELGDAGEERGLQTTRSTEGERVTGSCEGEGEARAGSGMEKVEEGGES